MHLRKETCEQVDFLYGISAELGQARQILGCSVHSFAPFVGNNPFRRLIKIKFMAINLMR